MISIFVDAELTRSMAGDIEEDKAVCNGQFTLVHDGEKAMFCMLQEISDSHLAARDKCGKSCQQTESDQNTAPELNDPPSQHQRVMKLLLSAESAKQFLGTVAREHESRNNA